MVVPDGVLAYYREVGPGFAMKLSVHSGTGTVRSDVLTPNNRVRRTHSRVVAVDTCIGLNRTKFCFTNRKTSPLYTDIPPVRPDVFCMKRSILPL